MNGQFFPSILCILARILTPNFIKEMVVVPQFFNAN